jgi:predicted permease
MAFSTVLLFMSALFLRSLQSATDMDLGFTTRAGAVVQVESNTNEYTTEERAAFVDELSRRLEAQGTVEAFGVTARMPLALGVNVVSFDIPGVEPPPDRNRHSLEVAGITPGYLDAMGIPILEGRAFDPTDRTGSQNVVILSEAAAERYWPGESAIGRVLYRNGDADDPLTVVGVAGNVKIWSLSEAPKPYMYLPYHQGMEFASFYVTARGTLPPDELAALIRDEARAIDPEIFLTAVGTMDDHLGYIYFLPRMAALLLSLVGLLALILACIGLYGMVGYGVSRRTREMGIRLAVGADRRKVIGLALRGGMGLVALGGLVGILVALALGRLAERFLYGVGGLDPLALLLAPAILGCVAAVAAFLPARRAGQVDPVQALRTE